MFSQPGSTLSKSLPLCRIVNAWSFFPKLVCRVSQPSVACNVVGPLVSCMYVVADTHVNKKGWGGRGEGGREIN